MQLYEEAVDIASTIATSDCSSPEAEIALKRFERMYWGQIGMDEPQPIEQAMIDFRAKLVELGAVSKAGTYHAPPAGIELVYLSLRLAKACSHQLDEEQKEISSSDRTSAKNSSDSK